MAYKIKRIKKADALFKEEDREKKKIFFRGIAYSNGLYSSALFEEFMVRRFPDELHESYIKEWVDRFKSGNPVVHMDSRSRQAYLDSINKLYGA